MATNQTADVGGYAGADTANAPQINKISTADLWQALNSGYQDFLAKPSHIAFLCVLYPIIGLIVSRIALNNDLIPLVYPLVTGYALVGPICAIGLYELSRRREQGLEIKWRNVFGVVMSPAFGSIVALSVGLLVLFAAWLAAAFGIYENLLGGTEVGSLSALVAIVLGTKAGWTLLVIGSGVGFVFAAIVLTFGVVSFPMLLDRNIGMIPAVQASARAVMANPVTLMIWGFIVAATLLIASIPIFIGLIVALPVLGHATWHLYRKLIS